MWRVWSIEFLLLYLMSRILLNRILWSSYVTCLIERIILLYLQIHILLNRILWSWYVTCLNDQTTFLYSNVTSYSTEFCQVVIWRVRLMEFLLLYLMRRILINRILWSSYLTCLIDEPPFLYSNVTSSSTEIFGVVMLRVSSKEFYLLYLKSRILLDRILGSSFVTCLIDKPPFLKSNVTSYSIEFCGVVMWRVRSIEFLLLYLKGRILLNRILQSGLVTCLIDQTTFSLLTSRILFNRN